MNFLKRLRRPSKTSSVPAYDWKTLSGVLSDGEISNDGILGHWGSRSAVVTRETTSRSVLRLSCRADLWCRKRTSVTTMLDPTLFEIYTTGDDRIDEEWIVQTNPPSAFRKEFASGCDALLHLLAEDPGLHATRGWLTFHPTQSLERERVRAWFTVMEIVVRTAERELKS